MNRLYVLGFTHDLKGVVFTQRRNGKTPTFWVPVDQAFTDALNRLEKTRSLRARGLEPSEGRPAKAAKGAKSLPPVGRSQARAGLPASEIQRMLREGKTIKTVAAAAKTDPGWIERLAEPVMTERAGVVRLAQRAYMSRARLGQAGMQLGDAVEANLEEKGQSIGEIDAVWDAKVLASGVWRVSMRFSNRGKRRAAEWEFRNGSRSIAPRNRLGAQLGWWDPEEEPEVEEAELEEVDEAQPPPPRRAPAAKTRAPARRKTPARRRR